MSVPEMAKERARKIAQLAEKLRNDLEDPDPAKPPFDDIYALRMELETLEQDLRGESSTVGDVI